MVRQETTMKLYGSPISTCTRKVLCTLAEKGAEVEFISVDIMNGEQKQSSYVKAHHPFAKVPAIEDDGFTMYESRAIIRYLDDTLPGTKLTPPDAKGRAMMEQWTSVEDSYFAGPALKIAGERVFRPMRGLPTDEKNVEAGKVELSRTLDVLEARLAIAPYLAGLDFSLADLGYLPYIDYLFASKEGEMITVRPHVAAWWKRISERPSWQKALGRA
jgi:glutathione S-transferase